MVAGRQTKAEPHWVVFFLIAGKINLQGLTESFREDLMPKDKVTRKLMTILNADALAYSRLTGADEVGPHRQLSTSLD